MMMWCWEMEPGNRPSFSTLVQTLSTSLEDMADYLHIGAFTDPNNEENDLQVQVEAIAKTDCETLTGQAEHEL